MDRRDRQRLRLAWECTQTGLIILGVIAGITAMRHGDVYWAVATSCLMILAVTAEDLLRPVFRLALAVGHLVHRKRRTEETTDAEA